MSSKRKSIIGDSVASVCKYKRAIAVTLSFLILLLSIYVIPTKAGPQYLNVKWGSHKVEYEILKSTPGAYKDMIKRAANQWTSVDCSCFTLMLKGQTLHYPGYEDGHNIVGFAHIDGPGHNLASCRWWADADDKIYEADIKIDFDEQWWPGPDRAEYPWYDLETVVLHEFGHFAGLAHTDQDEVMNSTIGRGEWMNLQESDKEGIRELYPSEHEDSCNKGQCMVFVAPFNLSELVIPGIVTFDLHQEDMIEHSLNLTLTKDLGGENVTLDFQSGYGEIFFDYTEEPNIVLFNITEWVMIYTEFYIPGKGWTGNNTAITSPESYGFLDIINETWGEMTVYEEGIYLNNLYTQENPITWWILYSGTANFTSNIIQLEGEGEIYFRPPPVGGVWVPVDKFVLLAPYIALASTILVATATTAIYVKRVKRRKKKQ